MKFFTAASLLFLTFSAIHSSLAHACIQSAWGSPICPGDDVRKMSTTSFGRVISVNVANQIATIDWAPFNPGGVAPPAQVKGDDLAKGLSVTPGGLIQGAIARSTAIRDGNLNFCQGLVGIAFENETAKIEWIAPCRGVGIVSGETLVMTRGRPGGNLPPPMASRFQLTQSGRNGQTRPVQVLPMGAGDARAIVRAQSGDLLTVTDSQGKRLEIHVQ
jgi:hypothetical protein